MSAHIGNLQNIFKGIRKKKLIHAQNQIDVCISNLGSNGHFNADDYQLMREALKDVQPLSDEELYIIKANSLYTLKLHCKYYRDFDNGEDY